MLAVWEIKRHVSLVYFDTAKAALKGNHLYQWFQQGQLSHLSTDLKTSNAGFKNKSCSC